MLISVRRIIKIVSPIFIIASISVACSSSGDYQAMNIKEGFQHFTFEYPKDYKLIYLNLENMENSVNSQVGISFNSSSGYSEIYIYVWYPASDTNTSEKLITALVNNAKSSLSDFSIVSMQPIMLGDIRAQQCFFTADSSGTTSPQDTAQPTTTAPVQPTLQPRPANYYITVMVQSGIAIEIDMTCDQTIASSMTDGYQHVLESFGLLD
ncbi:hypothetical protein Dform_01086 [Dehalogenimonas formicexedens]|uniref:Lipoprotein n=1 Tax=Dehalogenimonas formicexedens TaxID=1839801 RepID=A0A1P8F7H1_9CHLR|nr:hypothetical protein [Dehalogenimonas formicexedens]APV44421.1 hypothetical protein Dform_01086 [Dehalogenimonas formicexedens]